MKSYKPILFLLLFVSLSSFVSLHKYYISNTQIEYIGEKKSIQIITRIFIDDLENVLRERYDEAITLDDENSRTNDLYIEKYLNAKIKIKINDEAVSFVFIGKEMETGIVKSYLEIENVEAVKTFEISNQTLFDLFSEQQNIIKLDINSKQKSCILTKQNDTALLNFN
ncbi:DUF6702 family protein [Algibacter sp. 2305UL17-15]|uniref:DUF6702 family protein n=1 Tax=Algibacter sp. 2305UL17-15 TaxID=3231268 RepID=UPI003458E94F